MNNWIEAPLVLQGTLTRLQSLSRSDIPVLLALAADKSIWEHYVLDGSNSGTLSKSLSVALIDRQHDLQFPFTIYTAGGKQIIGSTRFLDLQQGHRKLEIGWTWLHPHYWGTGINTECKLLLLTHAFEQMHALRVQLKTDVKNIRSQKAIEKIGATREGIFRNDMVRENGTSRDSVYYSIVADEWPEVKKLLSQSAAR